MTPDEAMQAVRRAVEGLSTIQQDIEFLRGIGSAAYAEELEIQCAALRALAPGGPLVVVPREQLIRAVEAICSHECGHYDDPYRHTPVCSDCRAMIAEGEKK